MKEPTPAWRRISAAALKSNLSDWISLAIKFGLVGVINTGVDAGIYFMLTRWFGMGDIPVLAKMLSFSAGVINSYFWNERWTFAAANKRRGQFGIFVLVNTAALAINAGSMKLGLETLAIGELFSLLLATAAAFSWNFVLSKTVVFRNDQ